MRITTIDLFKADIPLKDPFKIAVMEMRSAANVFVRINTDNGLAGWGESSPFWKLCGETQAIDLAAGVDLARIIKDHDPLELDARMRDIDGFLKNNTQIRAAFDMALHDIVARSANVPLYRLLGGSKRPMRTCLTIAISDVATMVSKAGQGRVLGFDTIKLKLGTTAREDIERVRTVREALGREAILRIDANQGWDVPTAIAALRAIREFDIEFCEQPVPHWDLEGLKRVRNEAGVPVVADEAVFDHHDALKVMRADAADVVNIKLSKSGGIRTARKIAAVVEAAGKTCMIGCMMESRLGLTAAAHLAAASECIQFFDLDSAHLLASDPIIGGMRYDKDTVLLDERWPGLGVEPDPTFLKQCGKITI